MPINVDSYTSTSMKEIDTLRADAPYTVKRITKSVYHIKAEEHTFEVAVRNGGKNATLDFNSPYEGKNSSIKIEARDTHWPQSITMLRAREGNFHLEMIDDNHYAMVTPGQNLEFRTVSGPDKAYIAVTEVSKDVDHVEGPGKPREVDRHLKPRMPSGKQARGK